MAKIMTHVIEYLNDGGFFPDPLRTLSYGKCQVSPYVDNNLWFVSFPQGKYHEWKAFGKDVDKNLADYGGNIENTYQKVFPKEDTTFLVTENYARVDIFNQWKRDVKAWEKVAHKVFVGPWCAKYEQLWQDVPIHELRIQTSSNDFEINVTTRGILKNPTSGMTIENIKYGYCRTTKQQRDLWFVSFKDRDKYDDHTFIIDEICATPDFINHLGADPRKWEPLCWCYLRHEVEWDKINTGLDAKEALEHPHLESENSVDEIEQKIKVYRDEMINNESSPSKKAKKKGWFS